MEMEMDKQAGVARIQVERPESPVTIDIMPRRVAMYRVFETELENLGSAQNSVHLAFFGIAFGAALTLSVTLITVDINNSKTYASFWASLLVSVGASFYFGLRALFDWRKAKRHVRDIKEQNSKREGAITSGLSRTG
jgi:hypothetical protein